MKRIKKIVVILLAAAFAALSAVGIAGCAKNNARVTITFVTNGGSEISPAKIKKGTKYTLPTPTKEGLVFADWYYDENFETVCPEKITASKNLTLYARYGSLVSFETDGGTEVEPKIIFENDEIGTLPPSYKDGFSFCGWYYDSELKNIVKEKNVPTTSFTVYARFSDKAETLKKITSVKNVSALPSVEIKTDDVVLHNDNIAEYLSFTSLGGENVDVICAPSNGNAFIVTPNKKLTEGETYSVKTLSSLLKIVSVGGNDAGSADEVTLTTSKEEKEIITKNPTIHLTADELAKWEENVYVYMDAGLEKDVNRITARTNKEIKVGSIVTIGESGDEEDDDYICKVISARKDKMQYYVGSDLLEAEFVIMEVVTPNVDDVYADIDVYGERQAQLEGYISLSAETVADNVEKNEGVVMLKNAVKNAISASPTITDYAKGLSEEDNIALMAAIGGLEFQRPKVKIDISGTVLAFEIEISGEIQIKKVKIGVSVTIKNRTQVDYRYTICKSKLITINPLLWFYTDVKVDLANDFSLAIAATAEFSDENEDIHGVVDITDEVEYVMDIAKDGQNKFAEAITGSPLWDDESELEYVDIFSIPLGQIPLPVPVVSLMLEFNVVGSLGARAGLYVEFSHHYVESTNLTNGASEKGENGKPVMYNEFKFTRTTLANEIDVAVTLKGQVGFRCGLEAKLSVSFARLNNVAAVYVSFRFGPYIELSGLVSFRYSYDAVEKVSKTQLLGGMYLEVGLFVNAKIGAKFLVYDVNTDIFDKKIPLYGVGDRLIPLGFTDSENDPENPYVITSRYGGVRMSTVSMRYLDIVTGEKVVDNALRNRYGAYLNYSFELLDMPDYQTRDYAKYVRINGQSTLISKSFPFKSLKFAVKAKLMPKQGVYASGIERLFYVEFRNPDGRDYATQYSEFRNEYYAGGGSTYSETLANLAFLEGEQVVPPDFTAETLPVRQGYYLDTSDLWEKYYPFLGDAVDEEFDGTFPIVTYENANMLYKGYLIVHTCYYRLKWKQRTFTANFYYPEYETADKVKENKFLTSAEMIYVPSLSAFIVKTDKITAPDIGGKKYEAFESTSGLRFTVDYYNVGADDDAFKNIDIESGLYPIIRVDKSSPLYIEDFNLINGGATFIATYKDVDVYTETYVLETDTVKRVKVEYKPFDYGENAIRPTPPSQFGIGNEFTANGKNVYVITGYRDINPASEDNSRYYDTASMPDVTKSRIYYVLYERKGYTELPVYYVNVVANGQKIGDYGVKEGEEIKVDLLKANFDYKTIIGKLAGYPAHTVDQTVESHDIVWDEAAIPERMPDKDVTVNVTATYTLKELSAKFVLSNPLQSFVSGVAVEVLPDGSTVYVATGATWTYGMEDETAFYSLPELNDYYDADGKKYYAFYGWANSAGEEYPFGVRLAFVKNEEYTPVFVEKTVLPTIAFVSVGDYGYEYYYKIVEGDFYGKTLAEVIRSEKIANPVRGDVKGVREYEFTGWGVDEKTYVVGSEKDLGGNVKTYISFRAQFSEKFKTYTVTFDALGGRFDGGEKTLKVSGVYGDDISRVAAADYSDEKGDFAFVCWTTVPYSPDTKVDGEDLKIGNEDVTYYAYYTLDPATITLTFKGKAETESEDGTGNVYFNGDKSKTELKVSDLYGRGYYLLRSDFEVDSKSKTFVADYLRWTIDGEEYTSAFYNDGYMAYVPFDRSATIEIFFKPASAKIVNVAFVSDGECYEPDGTKIDDVICNGYMSGFRHVVNYYEEYGRKIVAPNVDYYSEKYYRFDRWETKPTDGNQPISVKPGEKITFTEDLVFYGVYVHDTDQKVRLTFRADCFRQDGVYGDTLVGLKIFPDGSVETEDFGTYGENITFDVIPTCDGMRFVGWTTDGETTITQSELTETTYDEQTTYYAVYEAEAEAYEITLDAGDGKFGDDSEKTINNVPYGKLAAGLEKPTPLTFGLVFSHYEDENGYPVTAIEKSETLYAKYALPVSTFEELKNVNNAPDKNYVLTADISAGGDIWLNDGLTDWTAIGADKPNGFSGVFNGNGHKITLSVNGRTKKNFGLFSKISGTVYNLCAVGNFTISGTTDATALGAFAGEVTASGRIIDCQSFVRFTVSVKSLQKLSVAGAIGVNNGLIDGFRSCAGGQTDIDGNKEFCVGSTVGTNDGVMKNINQSGKGGSVYVSLSRSLDCYIGSFAGYNSGVIENSFAERAITISLAQGDNVYLENSVVLGGFVGKNDGKIENATTLYGKLEFDVNNVTLFGEKSLRLNYNPYADTPCYTVSVVGKDNQGITYTTKCVIYLKENAEKSGSTEYEEYTLSEFKADHPDEAKKIEKLRKAVAFGSFSSINDGKTDNCFVVESVGTGNGVELVSSCGFDGLKWNYIERLFNKVYD